MNNIIDSICVKTTEIPVKDLNNRIDSLQDKLDLLQAKTDMLSSIIETSNDSVANQLAAANILLALIAVIVTVGSIIFGLYISRKKQEIEDMAKVVDEKKRMMDDIAATTKKLDKQIHNGISDLYRKLRKEETNVLLERLMLEPKDVSNLGDLLLAREIEDDGFLKIRDAYLKLKTIQKQENDDESGSITYSSSYEETYLLLLFQHFCYESLKDNEIRSDLVTNFEMTCSHAFKRDIIKSTIDICRAMSDEDSSFNKEDVLVKYLKALNTSKHKKLVDLKNILEQNIVSKTLLKNAIEQCVKDGINLQLFDITKQ